MLGEDILKILSKTYEPLSMIDARYKRLEMTFKTDEYGRPVLLFIGKRDASGKIKGERYVRNISTTSSGGFKDHWEHKGKAT